MEEPTYIVLDIETDDLKGFIKCGGYALVDMCDFTGHMLADETLINCTVYCQGGVWKINEFDARNADHDEAVEYRKYVLSYVLPIIAEKVKPEYLVWGRYVYASRRQAATEREWKAATEALNRVVSPASWFETLKVVLEDGVKAYNNIEPFEKVEEKSDG